MYASHDREASVVEGFRSGPELVQPRMTGALVGMDLEQELQTIAGLDEASFPRRPGLVLFTAASSCLGQGRQEILQGPALGRVLGAIGKVGAAELRQVAGTELGEIVDQRQLQGPWEVEVLDLGSQDPDQESHLPGVLGDAFGVGDPALQEAEPRNPVEALGLQQEIEDGGGGMHEGGAYPRRSAGEATSVSVERTGL